MICARLEGECWQRKAQRSSAALSAKGHFPGSVPCLRTTKFKIFERQHLFLKGSVEQTGNLEKVALMQNTQ